ncbi:MAG TPA: MFS transporter [Steroidobacteraceae bacterium]|nr:MFS transporter [Steroidobacteraceae bacterium]
MPGSTARGWLDAILVYRQPRMAAMLFLGFSAGLPFMLVFQTLSAWLRQAGIERATIGMLAWVGILYSIKFLWAPIVDRAPLPVLHRLLGRRRSWMLVAQVGVAIGLFRLAHCDPAADLMPVVLSALLVAFCSATQDISIDAWRIESAPVNQQGAMAAAYQLGYRVAIMTGTAGALWIAADVGWSTAYSTMAVLMLIGIATTLLSREPSATANRTAEQRDQRVIDWVARKAHWPESLRGAGAVFVDAVVCPLVDFFARYGLRLGVLIFVFISTYRLTDYAMGVMANPFYLDKGFSLKEIAAVVKGFGLIMALLGVVLGGTVVAKLGVTRALVLGSVLVMGTNLAFAAVATMPSPGLVALALVNSADNLSLGVHGTALIAFMSSLTSAKYTATQYALLSSLYALPGKLLMGFSGFVVDDVGYPWFFVYTASLSLPGLILLYWLVRQPPAAAERASA